MSLALEIKVKAAKSLKGLKYRYVKLAVRYITLCTVNIFRSRSLLTDFKKLTYEWVTVCNIFEWNYPLFDFLLYLSDILNSTLRTEKTGRGEGRSSLPGSGLSLLLSAIIAVYPLLIAVYSFLAFPHVPKHMKLLFKIFRKLKLVCISSKASKVESKVFGDVLMWHNTRRDWGASVKGIKEHVYYSGGL